jgi:hypothetical protein
MPRYTSVALMLCVAASSLLGAAPVQAAPPTTPAPALLHWAECPAGSGLTDTPRAQCATLAVPVDYAHPDGPRIAVMVSRIAARDPGHRIGTLFVNPGGPSGCA